MRDSLKTKTQLIDESDALRARVRQLEHAEADRQRVQEALLVAERDKAIVLDSMSELVAYQDPEGRIIWANRAAGESVGLAPQELVGRYCYEVWHQRTRRCQGCPVMRACETAQPHEAEMTSPDGRTWLIRAYPVRDAAGQVVGIVEVTRDITERKQAEQALRFTQFSVDHAADAAFWMGSDARFIYVNDAACRALGYSREELLSMTVHDIDPDFPTEVWPIHWEEIRSRGSFVLQSYHRRKDGHVFPVEVTVNYLEFDGREFSCAFARDITERKRAEEELRESEGRFRQIAQNSDQVFWLTDWKKKELLYVNPAYERIYGRSCQSLYQDRRSWLEAVHPQDRARVDEVFARKGARGEYTEAEYRIVHSDGSIRWIYDRSFPVTDAAEEVYRWVGVAQDITERKRAEEELAEHREHLEELVKARTAELEASQEKLLLAERLASVGTLAAGIAHEINNPVGGIMLAAQNALKLKGCPDSQDLLDICLQDIADNARRCGQITESVLQFAKRGRTKKSPGDLNATVRRCVLLTKSYVKEWGGVMELELADGLPEVPVSPLGMEQVFVNLIRNAVESSPDGVNVRIRTERAPGSVRVMVEDNGPGMSEEQVKHLFDPFYTTRRENGGTGLGLSIAHGIITDHGGTIDVESRPGTGTTFTIDLPPASAAAEEEAIHVQGTDR